MKSVSSRWLAGGFMGLFLSLAAIVPVGAADDVKPDGAEQPEAAETTTEATREEAAEKTGGAAGQAVSSGEESGDRQTPAQAPAEVKGEDAPAAKQPPSDKAQESKIQKPKARKPKAEPAPKSAAPDKPTTGEIIAARIGRNDGRTRFVLEATAKPVVKRMKPENAETDRVVLLFKNLSLPKERPLAAAGQGAIQHVMFLAQGEKETQVILFVSQPGLKVRMFHISPRGGYSHRFVVDLEAEATQKPSEKAPENTPENK